MWYSFLKTSRKQLGTGLLLWLLGYSAAHAQVPGFEWAVACGSAASSDYGVGASQVAVDAQGNTYVLGRFAGTITLGTNTLTAINLVANPPYDQYDIFVAKLDGQGQYQWAVRAGGDKNETGTGLAVDAAGGVYLTGYFASYSLNFGVGGPTLYNSSAGEDVFVAKLNAANGQCTWARRAGGYSIELAGGIAVTQTGDVCIVGSFESLTADFGATTLIRSGNTPGNGASDVFVAKLSSAGTWLWAVRGGGDYTSDYLNSLVVDAAGAIYVAGYFFGEPPCSSVFGSSTLVGVQTPTYDRLAGDGFVAKLDATGTWLWTVQGDAAGHNLMTVRNLVSDGQGHLYASGTYQGTAVRFGAITLPNLSAVRPGPNPAPPIPYTAYYNDAFVARLDASGGAWQWAVRTGGSGDDGINSLAVDTQGRVYVGGGSPNLLPYIAFPNSATTFQNPLPGATGNVTAAQLDGATGAWRWASATVGGVLAVGPADKLYMATSFTGTTATFGPYTVSGPGPYTGVVARLGTGPLATTGARNALGGLQVWPNPAGSSRQVRVAGVAAGQAVQVLDVLGRVVSQGRMPASGPLELALPAALPAGVYVVRGGALARSLVVE